jgi:hemin uptake protein HemP
MNNTPLLETAAAVTQSGDDAFERRFVMAPPATMAHVRSITSQQLFGEFPEVQIAHAGAVYRLRQTSLGKLILTK